MKQWPVPERERIMGTSWARSAPRRPASIRARAAITAAEARVREDPGGTTNRTGPRHKRRGGRERPRLLLLMAFLLIPVGVIGEMIESRSGGRETTVSRVASEGVAIGTGRKGLATELRKRRTGGWGLRVATTEWEPGVALARAAKERGPPRTKLNSGEFSEGLDPDPIALHTTATRAARPPLRGRHPPPVPCAGGARMREARISQPQAKVVQGRTARHPAQSAISYQKKHVARTCWLCWMSSCLVLRILG